MSAVSSAMEPRLWVGSGRVGCRDNWEGGRRAVALTTAEVSDSDACCECSLSRTVPLAMISANEKSASCSRPIGQALLSNRLYPMATRAVWRAGSCLAIS